MTLQQSVAVPSPTTTGSSDRRPRSIIDIPDAGHLATHTLVDLVGSITSRLGIDKPDVVCLPMIDYGGANYKSAHIDRNVGHWSGWDFAKIADEVRSKIGAELYLSIMASLDFIDSKPFIVRDQFGADKNGVCIVNPSIQGLIRAAIEEVVELVRPDGIILDICDINGQSGKNGRIEFTCFCPDCAEALHERARFDFSVFKSHPHPANLVLKDTGTGIQHFQFSDSLSVEELIQLSQANEIFNVDWLDSDILAMDWARTVLHYIKARSLVTADAVRAIGDRFRQRDIRFGAVICSPRFDWTAGVDLNSLKGAVDEVWTDPDDLREHDIPAGIDVYHYLANRARYMIDAYFELASQPSKLAAIAGGATNARSGARELLSDRTRGITAASQVKLANVAALKEMGSFAGYVAPPLFDFVMQRINDRVLQFLPVETEHEDDRAAKLMLYLMQVADSGTAITMDVLQQIAARLGLLRGSQK